MQEHKTQYDKTGQVKFQRGEVREPLIWNWDTRSWLSSFEHVSHHSRLFSALAGNKSLANARSVQGDDMRLRWGGEASCVPLTTVLQDGHAQPQVPRTLHLHIRARAAQWEPLITVLLLNVSMYLVAQWLKQLSFHPRIVGFDPSAAHLGNEWKWYMSENGWWSEVQLSPELHT